MSQSETAVSTSDSVTELRQYTLHPGRRDDLIDLFEREFVEGQESAGMTIAGQFRDSGDPDRFVWVRGFRDMKARADALDGFYSGPVWRANSGRANATMVDSDNVLLLRPAAPGSGFPQALEPRPPVGSTRLPGSVVKATIYYRVEPVDEEFVRFFQTRLAPLMTDSGAAPAAYFRTEPAENTFPALPVREGENVFVWFALFPSGERFKEHRRFLDGSAAWNDDVLPELRRRLAAEPQELLLEPTARSQFG